jgi:hypothetical protein
VTKEEYKQAQARHAGSYPGLGSGQRNAIVEHQIACRGIKWQIRRVVNTETQPMSSPGGQMSITGIVDVLTEPMFDSDVEAKKRADELGTEYCIAPLIGR